MSTQLKIETTFNGKSSTRTLSAINPAATNAEMKTFAQALTSMTGNTYVMGSRVTTTDLNEADKTQLEIGEWEPVTMAELKTALETDGKYHNYTTCVGFPLEVMDYKPFAVTSPYSWLAATAYLETGEIILQIRQSGTIPEGATGGTFVINIPETETTAAATTTMTIAEG